MLVEAGGRSLFYTGDIRGHGRKSGLFEELLRKPPTRVDVLLMEGTNIRPADSAPDDQDTETDIELALTETMKATKGMVLVVSSAQNIDRLVTIYRASLRAYRDLVVDLYGASIARATGNPNIPQPGPAWPRVHVFVPQWQRIKVKQAADFDRVAAIREHRVYGGLPPRASVSPRLDVQHGQRSGSRQGGVPGGGYGRVVTLAYLEEDSGRRLVEFLDTHGIPMVHHHTSGHASIADLKRLANAIDPARLVPIHSFAGGRFSDFFSRASVEPDGSWWDV